MADPSDVSENERLRRLGITGTVENGGPETFTKSDIPDYYSRFHFIQDAYPSDNPPWLEDEEGVDRINSSAGVIFLQAPEGTDSMMLEIRASSEAGFGYFLNIYLPEIARNYHVKLVVRFVGDSYPFGQYEDSGVEEFSISAANESERIFPNMEEDDPTRRQFLRYEVNPDAVDPSGDGDYVARKDVFNGATWVFEATYENETGTWWSDYGGRFFFDERIRTNVTL